MARSLRPSQVFPITTRTLQVLRVADVTPGMRRITLGGEELAAHTAANGYPVEAFRSDGFDDHCKMLFRHPDTGEAIGPEQADGVLNWPTDPRMLVRTYTIRRWDPEAGEVDIDFVKHGVGPATRWAYSVQPGESIQIAGPKSSEGHPEGADWLLIAGDETALPAIARWCEEMPADTRGQVFVEVERDEHRQEFAAPDGVRITWLSRDGAEAGTTTLMHDALTRAPWWDGTVFAWVAGETSTLTPIRRWLRGDKGLDKHQVDVAGYWRRAEVVTTDDSGVQDFEAGDDTRERFGELAEITPGFALRVAATIGLGPALSGRTRSLDELVADTGADPRALAKLLRYLRSLEIVDQHDDGRYGLTQLGAGLDDDHVIDELDLTGLEAHYQLGSLALLSAVRTGRGDYARWFGAPFEQLVQDTPALIGARIESQSETSTWVAGPLAEVALFAQLRTLALTGRAAPDLAEALVAEHADLHITVIATPAEIEAARRLHAVHERIVFEPGSLLNARTETTDAVLISGGLSAYPDADAVHLLRQSAAGTADGGSVLVFGDVLDEKLAHEHDFEHDLLDFAVYGGGARDHDEHLALFDRAGLRVRDRLTVGWGLTLYRLRSAS